MKILSVIDSFDEIAKNRRAGSWYVSPDSSLIRSGKPFFIPDFEGGLRGYPSLALRVERLGKGVAEKFAHRYFTHVAPAVSLVAGASPYAGDSFSGEDILFDGSFWIGDFVGLSEIAGTETVFKNVSPDGVTEIGFRTDEALDNAAVLISQLTMRTTIKIGDIITLGTPGAFFRIGEEDRLHATCADKELLAIHIK